MDDPEVSLWFASAAQDLEQCGRWGREGAQRSAAPLASEHGVPFFNRCGKVRVLSFRQIWV